MLRMGLGENLLDPRPNLGPGFTSLPHPKQNCQLQSQRLAENLEQHTVAMKAGTHARSEQHSDADAAGGVHANSREFTVFHARLFSAWFCM